MPVTERARVTDPVYPQIRMVTIEFLLSCDTEMELPHFPATSLRGAFGTAFREHACVTRYETCEGCQLVDGCAYGLVWETPAPLFMRTPRRYGTPHRPYVLDAVLPSPRRHFLPGDRLRIRLKVFGEARNLVPHFIVAMREAGKLGVGDRGATLTLAAASSIDVEGRDVRLYTERDSFHRWNELRQTLVTPRDTLVGWQRVRLALETPLELTDGGRTLRRFDPVVFTKRLAERLDALSLFHERRETSWDYRAVAVLAAQARVVQDRTSTDEFNRRSRRGPRPIPMKGIVGEVLLEDVHPRVVALWRCAEHIHAGKNATFGFGRVRVDLLSA